MGHGQAQMLLCTTSWDCQGQEEEILLLFRREGVTFCPEKIGKCKSFFCLTPFVTDIVALLLFINLIAVSSNFSLSQTMIHAFSSSSWRWGKWEAAGFLLEY